MIPECNFKRPAKILGQNIESESYIIQSNQSKNRKLMVQNLSWRIFFQEQIKFLKSFNFTMHQTKIHFFYSPSIKESTCLTAGILYLNLKSLDNVIFCDKGQLQILKACQPLISTESSTITGIELPQLGQN